MMPVNRNPSASDLRWFGILFVVFAGVVGGMAAWRHRAIVTEAEVIWAIGAAIGLLYFAVPPLQRPLYVGWMYAVFPIGWTVSHALMAVIYYGVFTPIGFVLRSTGRDTLDKDLDRSARSYWVRYTPQRDVGRYFKQF